MAPDDPQPQQNLAPSRAPSRWRKPLTVALTLGLGTAGGALFFWLTLPLAWMLGAMTAVTTGALAGVPLRMPGMFRSVMITVLGIMLGSAFTPEVVARMGQWMLTLSALMVWSVLVGFIALVYFRRVAGYDPVTAYFSATPGGLNEMVIVGGAMGGDDRTISLTHAARVMLVVFTIPLWYRFGADLPSPASARPYVGLLDIPLPDVMILGLCALFGAVGARALRIPAAFLVGPMVLSAVVHLGGLTASKPPDPLVAAAQVVLGATVGCRFAGMRLMYVVRTAAHAAVSAVMMLGATIAFALALAPLTGYPIAALVLAFAPGGLAEMSLIALALSVDTAFVASHHIARIVMVVTMAPFVFKLMRRSS